MSTDTSKRGGKVKKITDAPSRPPLPVRLTPEMVDRVDAIRPEMIPREPFVRHLIELGINVFNQEEAA